MKLNIEAGFVDKYTGKVYKLGDVISVEEERGLELLADPRKLVSLNSTEDTADKPEKTAKKSKRGSKKKPADVPAGATEQEPEAPAEPPAEDEGECVDEGESEDVK